MGYERRGLQILSISRRIGRMGNLYVVPFLVICLKERKSDRERERDGVQENHKQGVFFFHRDKAS